VPRLDRRRQLAQRLLAIVEVQRRQGRLRERTAHDRRGRASAEQRAVVDVYRHPGVVDRSLVEADHDAFDHAAADCDALPSIDSLRDISIVAVVGDTDLHDAGRRPSDSPPEQLLRAEREPCRSDTQRLPGQLGQKRAERGLSRQALL